MSYKANVRHLVPSAAKSAFQWLGLAAAIGATSPTWAGIPKCSDYVAAPNVVMSQSNALESIVFDKQGRMLLSNINKGEIWALASPGGAPTTVASGISTIGGLALGEGDDLYVGSGNSLNGAIPSLGAASIYKVNLASGETQRYATGLAMSNGVKRAADGTLYVSDDLAKVLGRVTNQNGSVHVDKIWLAQNSNGMVLSADGKTLYVNQTFPSKLKAVDLTTSPPVVSTIAAPAGLDSLSVFDGLAMDRSNNLFIAAWLAGKVLKADTTGSLCVLAEGLSFPSDLAVGVPPHFNASSLYVTTHSGKVFELPGAAH